MSGWTRFYKVDKGGGIKKWQAILMDQIVYLIINK